jgi:cellulose synthase/poly-beta-1,6-N-acetylglucosamine synthase-like glycosyltransferase
MIQFSIPKWVKQILSTPLDINQFSTQEEAALKKKLSRFNEKNPEVSVVIPAWNEELGILHTLQSLANTYTLLKTELIVVDNNSTDGTSALLNRLGVQTVLETKQGVGNARTCGLHRAKGEYILTCDSDTLYPPGWITAMTMSMKNGQHEPVYVVHGSYSFLPSHSTPRWQYALYEMMSSIIIRKKEKHTPFLNTLGFNCGFVRARGIAVNGYEIETQRVFRGAAGVAEGNATEDGMMALRLQQAGGKNKWVSVDEGRVWTSDRRIQLDGGLFKAMSMRLKKHLFSKFPFNSFSKKKPALAH